MRRLRTSYAAVFVATIVTLFIVGACSQQPPPAPAIEPVAPPTSTLGDSGDELSSNQVVDQASHNNSTQGDPQTTNTTDPTATATHADIETIIDGILAELLNDAITNRRDLEEELEADMSLLSDDEQALIGVGE
jgi:hypothetical protein